MANLEGMPIGSLPELTGDLQDEDEVVVYRPSTGKAYQANTDLIDSLSDQPYFNSLDALVAYANSFNQYQMRLVYVSNTVMGALGGASGVSKGIVTKAQSANNTFDFFLWATSGQYVYTGRYSNGTITLYRLTTTAV